jgi:hypothetical protein
MNPIQHRTTWRRALTLPRTITTILSALAAMTVSAQTFPPVFPVTDATSTVATKGGSIKKTAVDKNSGAPITGLVPAGTEVKFIIEYDLPDGTAPYSLPVTITDTMSSNLTYVTGSLVGSPGWSVVPNPPFNTTGGGTATFSHASVGSSPGFVLPVNVGGVGNLAQGTGDGFTPIVVANRVWSISHHEFNARVNCYEKSTMMPCTAGTFSPKTENPVGHAAPTFSRYVIHDKKIYYPAFRSAFSGIYSGQSYSATPSDQYGIGCYDTAKTPFAGPCTVSFTPLENFVAGDPLFGAGVYAGTGTHTNGTAIMGHAPGHYGSEKVMAGVVSTSSDTSRIYSHVKNTVYCHVAPAMAPCTTWASWPAGKTILSAYATAATQLMRDIDVDNQNQRLYVHNGRQRVYCFDLTNGNSCANWPVTLSNNTKQAWISPTMTSSAMQDGICISGANHIASPGVSDCFNNGGVPQPVKAVALAANFGTGGHGFPYRLPSMPSRVLFSNASTLGFASCVSYATGTPASCGAPFAGSFANGARPAAVNPATGAVYSDYGYMADPENSSCVYGLGDGQMLVRFDAATGAAGCASKATWVVPNPASQYCDGKNHNIQWGAVTILSRPTGLTGGTIVVKNKISSAVIQTITVTSALSYTLPAGIYAGNPELSIEFNPIYAAGQSPTANFVLFVTSTATGNPQICYLAKTGCGPMTNSVTMSWGTNGPPPSSAVARTAATASAVSTQQSLASTVQLSGPTCDPSDPGGGGTGVTSEPCCDKAEVAPSQNINDSRSIRHFTIFNTKDPFSPICSVDVTLTPLPPLGGGTAGYWNGGDAKVDGIAIGNTAPTGFAVPYTRLPYSGTFPSQAASGLSPAVQFFLGLDKTGGTTPTNDGYSGTVTLTINHCDGTKCTVTYRPWVINSGSAFRLAQAGSGLTAKAGAALTSEFIPISIPISALSGNAKHLVLQVQNDTHEIFAVSGPSPDVRQTKGGSSVAIGLGETSGRARAAISTQSVDVVLRAKRAGSASPVVRYSQTDAAVNEVAAGTLNLSR